MFRPGFKMSFCRALAVDATVLTLMVGLVLPTASWPTDAGEGPAAEQIAGPAMSPLHDDAPSDALARALMDSRSMRAFVPKRFTGAADAAFSSDGSLLAVVDFPCGKRLTVLDVLTVEPGLVHAERSKSRKPPCDPAAGYASVAFAPGDGSVLASDRTGTDVLEPTGTAALKVSRFTGTRAVNPRDRRVALPSDSGRSVDYRDDALDVRRELFLDGERAEDLSFSADGRRLIVRTRRSLLVWDVTRFTSGKSGEPDPDPTLVPLRIPLDGALAVKRLATDFAADRIAVILGNAVRVWDLGSGQRIGEIQVGAGMVLECAALWPGRDYLVTGGGGAHAAPTVAVWNISTGKYVGALQASVDRKVTAVAFDAEGHHLATVDSNGGLALWLFPRRPIKDAAWGSPPVHPPHLP